jgi:uncharacterized protein YsxB (DUF464 family)
MIKVIHKQNLLNITGHSGSGVKGKDLVCAGVSSIVFGALNWFSPEDVKVDRDDCCGKIEIVVIKNKKPNNYLLNLLMVQILTVQHSFPKQIKVLETNLKGV